MEWFQLYFSHMKMHGLFMISLILCPINTPTKKAIRPPISSNLTITQVSLFLMTHILWVIYFQSIFSLMSSRCIWLENTKYGIFLRSADCAKMGWGWTRRPSQISNSMCRKSLLQPNLPWQKPMRWWQTICAYQGNFNQGWADNGSGGRVPMFKIIF